MSETRSRLKGCLFNIFLVVLTWSFASVVTSLFADYTSTMSVSPDEEHRIVLIELTPRLPRLDRNFKIVLETLGEHGLGAIGSELLFHLPDSDTPVGTERFIWSKDSTYVLLVGKHFFVQPDLPISGGGQAFLLYHLPTRRSWHKKEQFLEGKPELTKEVLQGIEFEQPLGNMKP